MKVAVVKEFINYFTWGLLKPIQQRLSWGCSGRSLRRYQLLPTRRRLLEDSRPRKENENNNADTIQSCREENEAMRLQMEDHKAQIKSLKENIVEKVSKLDVTEGEFSLNLDNVPR